MAGRDAVRELLKEFLQTEEKLYQMETWYIRNEERAQEMVNICINVVNYSRVHKTYLMLKAKITPLSDGVF